MIDSAFLFVLMKNFVDFNVYVSLKSIIFMHPETYNNFKSIFITIFNKLIIVSIFFNISFLLVNIYVYEYL